MPTLFKEVNYSLSKLIQDIEMGIIGLPDIQRPFVWPDTKVRDLFDSMYKGYPVGYLLFWTNADQEGTRTIGDNKKQKNSSLLIVDGQQRLTSLYAVIKGISVLRENYSTENIEISFKPLEEKFEIPDAATRKSAEYIHNISEIWNSDTNVFQFIQNFVKNLKETREVSPEEERKIQDAIMQLQKLDSYPFSALELAPHISEEHVADVFVRINSQGKSLNMADFILTLMSVFWDEGRHDLERFCRSTMLPDTEKASAFNYIIQPKPDHMLRVAVGLGFKRARMQYVYSILRGKDLETGDVSIERRETQFEILKKAQEHSLDILNFHEFLKALQIAGFNREESISSQNTILYAYVLFLIGRIDLNVPLFDLKNLIARWFFMTSLKGRYTGSPETVMETDLTKMREMKTAEKFTQWIEETIQMELTSDYWSITLPGELATSSPRSPSLFAYFASLNILNANGLFSKSRVLDLLQEGLKSKKSPLEKHHIFPKAYLQKQGLTDLKEINQIANFALVEWNDNIEISDTSPEEYLPEYTKRFSEEELNKMWYWHALPNNWEKMEYQTFLEERRKLIAGVIRDAFKSLQTKNA